MGQHLEKFEAKVEWHVFSGHGVSYIARLGQTTSKFYDGGSSVSGDKRQKEEDADCVLNKTPHFICDIVGGGQAASTSQRRDNHGRHQPETKMY